MRGSEIRRLIIKILSALSLAVTLCGVLSTFADGAVTYRLAHSLRLGENWSQASVSGNGRVIATFSDGVSVWDMASGKRIAKLGCDTGDAMAQSVRLSSTGRYLACASGDDALEGGELELWDVNRRHRIAMLEKRNAVRSMCFSKDESLLAYTTFDRVVVWSIAKRRMIYSAKVTESSDVALSPRGIFVAFEDQDGLRVVDVRYDKVVASLPHVHVEYLWFPDRVTLRMVEARGDTNENDVRYRIWTMNLLTFGTLWVDVPNRSGQGRLSHYSSEEKAVAGHDEFAIEGAYGVSTPAAGSRGLTLWNCKSGALDGRVAGVSGALSFSDDGKVLVVADGKMVRWFRRQD